MRRRDAVPAAGAAAPGGFSLVELLVAMTVGLILMSGTLAVFVGSKRSGELTEALSDMQESARFALDGIARAVRMSAYQGCVGIDGFSLGTASAPIVADDPPTDDLAATAVAGFAIDAGGAWSPDGGPQGFDTDAANAIPGSHALLLQYGGPEIASLAGGQSKDGVPDATAPLRVAGDFPLAAGELAIVSDCERAELFRASGVTRGTTTSIAHAASSNASGTFFYPFGQPAAKLFETRVMRFHSDVYYVADTGLENAAGQPVRALYRQSLPYDDPDANPPVEIARGVEQMRLAFGIDIGGGGVGYVAPGAPGYAPRSVVAVQVGLLMGSFDAVSGEDDARSYTLAGQTIGPRPGGASDAAAIGTHAGDARARLAFNTTVKVRNRR